MKTPNADRRSARPDIIIFDGILESLRLAVRKRNAGATKGWAARLQADAEAAVLGGRSGFMTPEAVLRRCLDGVWNDGWGFWKVTTFVSQLKAEATSETKGG
jgi:hypothetical protein